MLTIKNAYFIRGDMIQNWYVSDIEWDENHYTMELSRMWKADVIDLNIKIKRNKKVDAIKHKEERNAELSN